MGKGKCLIFAEKKPSKSKTAKPSVRSHTEESTNKFDIDLLEHLRDTTKRNKLNGIDEKIKLLKSELITLLNNNQTESKENCEDFNHSQIDKKTLKPIFFSTPAKCSEQVTDRHTKIFVDTEEQNAKNLLLNLKSHDEINKKSAVKSLLSQQKIEELLYKSFILQNSTLYFSLHDDNDSECKESAMKTEKYHRSEKQSKCNNKKYIQQNLNKYYKKTQRGKKRRRIDANSSQRDLDSSSCSNKKPTIIDTIYIDLDVKDYDWNEPFNVDNTEILSESETSESNENKETGEIEELKLNPYSVTAEASYNDDNDKSHLKKVWECPVCFEQSKGQEVVATQCGHVFCKTCVENHFMKIGKNCPSCRTSLKRKPLITLFNF